MTAALAYAPTAAADHWAKDKCSVDHELDEVGGTNIQYATGHTDGNDVDVWRSDDDGYTYRVVLESDDEDGDVDEEFNVRLWYREPDGDCVGEEHERANGPAAVVTLFDDPFRGGSDAAWVSVACSDTGDGCSASYQIVAYWH